jgi:hypothetical protein
MKLLMMLLRASRRVFIGAIHLIFIVVASYLAFWLRYDGISRRDDHDVIREVALCWQVFTPS